MLDKYRKYLWFWLILPGIFWAAAAGAQTTLTGELGLDYENYQFNNSLADTVRDYSVSRSLSNHSLDFRLTGPLISEQLANYASRAMILGTYYRLNGSSGTADKYFRPQIPTYGGTLTLFPARPYPLRLEFSKTRVHSIRYEANNRSKIDLESPELAIVRRYQIDLNSRSGVWKVAFADNIDLTTEVKRDRTEIHRGYDLGEDRDIWVNFSTLRPDSLKDVDTIDVINSIPGDTVLLYVDLNFVDSLAPAGSVRFPLDSGFHQVEFYPLRNNHFRALVAVRGDMRWEILPSPPTTPNDLEQRKNAATGILRVGGDGRFRSETYFEYSDTDEQLQDMIIYLSNFSNTASYELGRDGRLRTLTSYSQNQTSISDISSQLNKAFMQQTTVDWGKKRGLTSTISHSYTKMSTRTDVDDFTSNTHILSTRNVYPINKFNYTLDLKNSASLLTDSRAYTNNQYSSELNNTVEFHLSKTKWRPRNLIKYSYNLQKNPDKSARELETGFSLTGDIPRVLGLGDLKLRGDYKRRKRTYDDGSDIRNRYFADIGLVKDFGGRLKFKFDINQEKETYGGTSTLAGENANQNNPARQPLVKDSYKIDVQATPWDELNFSGNILVIRQGSTKITRFGVSLLTTVPKLNIPLRSFLLAENRDLVGLPTQSQLSMETRASYRFRQVTITLSHHYVKETLLTEKYHFQEVRIKIARHFAIL